MVTLLNYTPGIRVISPCRPDKAVPFQSQSKVKPLLPHIGVVCLALLVHFCTIGGVSAQSQTYSTTGNHTFVVPPGVTSVTVKVWGGGGGGGHSDDGGGTTSSGGGGGGGGGFRTGTFTVIPGQEIDIVVGVGGVGANDDGEAGQNGGQSSATYNALEIIAFGGLGGGAGVDGSTGGNGGDGGGGSGGSGGFIGGDGAAGGTADGGKGGGGAGDANDGGAASGRTGGGAGGAAGGGAGGNGGTSSADGTNGSTIGGGGGGTGDNGDTNDTGGNGARGQVELTWTCPTYSLTSTSATNLACGGNPSAVTLTGSAASLPVGTYTVTYNLSGANTATGNTATMTVTVAGSGVFNTSNLNNTGSTTITITNLAGGASPATCSNSITSNNTASITVTQTVPATPGTITGDQTICVPNTTDLVYSISAVSGADSYTWTVPTGWSITAGQGTTSITATSGTNGGNITVTATNTCGSGGARTLAVTVNNDNNIGFNSNNATNALTICEGDTPNTIDGNNPSGGQTYAWEVSTTSASGPFSSLSPNPGNVEDITISSTYYNNEGVYYFRRVISGGNACDGPSDVVTLTVTTTPAITACPTSTITADTDDGLCSAAVTYDVTASGATSITYSFSGATSGSGSGTGSGSSFNTGNTLVTVTAVNTCGNEVCTFTVTVTDDEAPVVTCPGNITVNNDNGVCGATVNFSAVTATDNCAITNPPTLTLGLGDIAFTGYKSDGTDGFSFVTFVDIAAGAQIVFTDNGWLFTGSFRTGEGQSVWTAATTVSKGTEVIVTIDGASSSATTGTISSIGSHIALSTDGDQLFAFQGTLAAPTLITGIQMNGTWDLSAFNSNTSAKPSAFTDGLNSLAISPETDNAAYDCSTVSGTSSTLRTAINTQANWTVNDNTITLPACNFNINETSLTLSQTNGLASGSVFPVGETTNTFTAVDPAGNNGTCSFTVTVNDVEDPAANCPANISVNNDPGQCGANVSFTVTSSDNCPGETINSVPASGAFFPVGATPVNVTVTDASDNDTPCSFTVTVTDNTAPTAVCGDPVVQLDANGMVTLTGNEINENSSDNCGIATLTPSPASFNCNDVGPNSVILTVTDVNGNASTCSATVTVEDNVDPVAVCQDVTVQLNAAGLGSTTAAAVNNGSSDACGIASLALDETDFDCAEVGANTVILTVTDVNGNTSNCTATVTVEDNIDPVAVCLDITVDLDQDGEYTLLPIEIDGGSSDACGIDQFSANLTDFDCSHVGDNTVTLTVSDENGNTSTCTATVTVEDNVNPTAVCQNVTVQLDADGNGSTTASAVNNGSSDACGIASLALDETDFDCSEVGANTVILTVTDVNGNSSTCSATVTVEDNVDPVAVCQDLTVQLNAAGLGSTTAAAVNNGSSDACGIASLVLDETDFDCAEVGANTVILTVTDVNGNTSTCTATVTVEDNIDPVAVCLDITVDLDQDGEYTLLPIEIDGGSSDACGIDQFSANLTDFDCSHVGDNTVTLTVSDENGNTSTCTATVTVEDNVNPAAVCQNVTVQLDADGNGSTTASAVNNGSSDACGIASLALDETDFDCSEVGANTVILTVTDVNGNASTCSATITVEDNVDPVAVCQDLTVQLNAAGLGSTTAAAVNNGSSDACGIASLALDETDFDCAEVGANTVILTVTDVNGNTSTCTATVTVEDNIDPVAVCLHITVDLDQDGEYTLLPIEIDGGSSDACGIDQFSANLTDFDCSHVGDNTVTLTVSDENGNTSTCTATVTVEDNVNPAAICQNVTVQLDADGNGSTTASAVNNGSSDACGIASLALDETDFDCSEVGANTVILTVTDVNGNASTCSATVTVEDNVDPVAVCQDLTVQLNAAGLGSTTAAAVNNGSSDACGIASLVLDETDFDCAEVGANTVTLTVTDVNGNTSTCTASVTVEDNIDPVAVCLDITVDLDQDGEYTLLPIEIDGGSSDACGIDQFSANLTDFDCSHVGDNTVTLTVSDENGNTSTCTATVTVEDNVNPTAVCQNVTVQLDADGNGSTTAAAVNNGSSDACGIASLALDETDFDCSEVGANTVILTVTDVNGNASTCTATVTVEDHIDPIAVCQNLTVELDNAGNATVTAAEVDNGSSDACGIADLSLSQTIFTCADVGNNAEILTVTDVNGNISTCSTTIKVQDNVSPEAICQDVTVQLNAAGTGSTTAVAVNNGSSDACGIASLTLDETDFDCSAVGPNTVTLTVTDINGNTSTCSATVTVEDNVDPGAICQDVTVQLNAAGVGSTTATAVNNGSSDACGIASLALDETDFDCSEVGPNPVTLTVTDVNGNSSTCTATITVEDNVDPVIVCPLNIQVDALANNCSQLVSWTPPVPTDACGIASRVVSVGPDNVSIIEIGDITAFGQFPVGSNTVTYTATDINGNQADCSFTVTVVDNLGPTFVNCPNDITVNNDPGDCGANVTWTALIVNDNCDVNSLVPSHNSGDFFDVGTTTVTYIATDDNNNSSQCQFNVTVNDNEDPTALCQNIIVQLDNTGTVSITALDVDGGSTDNCAIAGISVNPTSFDCNDVGGVAALLTVTDIHGNASTCSATVTVEDNVDPVAICQDVTVQLNTAGTGSTTAAAVNDGSSDACGIASLSLSETDFDCSEVGDNPVTLTVTDNNGNTSTCTATVSVEDNVDPVAICQDVTVQLNAAGTGSTTAAAVNDGSSDACGIASLSLSETDFDCSEVGDNTVTLTVTDNNGNTSTCTATVTVEDNVDPVAICQDVTVQLNAAGVGSTTAAAVNDGSSDACGIASLSLSETDFDCSEVGDNTVTLTVTDNNGNTSTCTATVSVEDNVDPVAICQDVTVQLNAAGTGSTTAAAVNDGSSDACGIASLSLSETDFDCSEVGDNPVTLTVTDANGNASTCTATVTVEDNVDPVAICQDVTVQLNAAGTGSTTAAAVNDGSSDACGIASLSLSETDFDCSEVGDNTVTLTVTDNNGNTSTCTATVTVEDNVDPVAICQDVTVQLNAAGTGSTTAAAVNDGSSDACGIASLSLSETDFDCSEVGDNTVTLTVTDNNGNTSTCTATVTVEDNVDPVAICQDVTVQLNAAGTGSTTAAAVNDGSSDACGIASLSLSETDFDCSEVGDNTVTLTVTDANGNASTCTATVTVEDNVDPVAICQDVTVQLNAAGTGSTTAAAVNDGSSDACGIASLSLSETDFDCSEVGDNPVTLTVTDNNGNTSTCTATVSVEDNVDPVAICQDVTVQLNAAGTGSTTAAAVNDGSSDACGIASLSLSETDFDCSEVGDNTVTLTVTDNNGNTSTCTATVTVEDNVDPVAICQDVTVQLNAAGTGSTTAAAVNDGSSDACGIASLSLSETDFDCSEVGDNTVTLTVTDANGNASTCTATVTVEDNVDPVAICQDVTVQLNAAGTGSTTAAAVNDGSSDACGIASLSLSETDFDCSEVGDNTVTLTVTDANGNASTCTATVTVEDNVDPVAICQDVTVQLNAAGTGSTTAAAVNDGSSDACGIASLSLSETDFDCSEVGDNPVTLTVTDANGNASTCTATVTVEDNVNPVALCQDVTVQLNAAGTGSTTAAAVNDGSSDACGIASLSLSETDFDCSEVGDNPVTLTVTDANGNASTCTATVTVEDNVDPVAICQDVTVQLNAAGTGSTTAAAVNDGSSDACGIASLSLSETDFDCSEVGDNPVTLTVTDNNGNTSTCTATVTVEDNVDPVAICQDVTVQLNAAGTGSTTAAAVNDGSSDACGIASLSLSETDFDCSEVGDNTVTLTVTDNNGNTSTCTATVTVEDNVDPVALCQDVTVQLNAAGTGSTTAAAVNNGSSDACGIASLSLSETDFDCSEVGDNPVTLTVTDANGNASTCTATVTVEDNVDPVALCQDVTVQLNAAGTGSTTAAAVNDGSSDACGIASLSLSETDFDCSEVGDNPVTLTVTDNNGNTSTCTATVTVEDNVDPVAICQDVTVQLNAAGTGSTTAAAVNDGSSDACGIASLSLSETDFDCSEVGDNTVTLTVTDNNGNTSTCTATVSVEDNVDPVAICQDVTVQLNAAGTGSTTAAAVNDGSSDACGIASLSLSETDFDCSEVGDNTVTLTVTDNNGNTSTCTATVTVEDNVDPVAICQDVTVQLNAAGVGSTTAAAVNDGSSDACGIASLSLSETDFDCSEVGDNTVTLTVTDNNGNTSTCTATVTVEDNVDPVAICQDLVVQLDESGVASIAAGEIDNGSSDVCGIADMNVSPNIFNCEDIGENLVTLTVTDVNGNTSTCTAIVTAEDHVDPVAVCQDVTVQLDANGNGSITAADVNNGSSDACNVSGLQLSQTDFDCSDVGTPGGIPVTLTITDLNGNSSACTAIVTVEDHVAPVALCQDITVVLDTDGQGVTTPQVVNNGSNDACGILNLGLSRGKFDCGDVGVVLITLNVTDLNNNTASCISAVTIVDLAEPEAVCKDVTVQLDADGNGFTTAAAVNNGSTDACGLSTLSLDETDFDCTEVGANNVTLTVLDINGNTSTCTATVTVEDNVDPIAVCQNVTVQLDENGMAGILPGDIDNGSSDACGIQSMMLNQQSFSCTSESLVTLTVTDVNGNASTCSATVTIEDESDPEIECKDVTVTLNGQGTITLDASTMADGADNCIIAGFTADPVSVTCANLGQVIPVTVTATDPSGNSASCTSNVTVAGLPCGWMELADGIGCTNGSDGSYNIPTETFSLTASGCYTPSATSDESGYIKFSLCGNGSITARVASLTLPGFAGIVMRESEAPGAKKVALVYQGVNSLARYVRYTNNGPSYPSYIPTPGSRWLRIVRTGNIFRGYHSVNGISWIYSFAVTVPMNSCIQVGLIAWGTNPNSVVTATFDHVTIDPPYSGSLPKPTQGAIPAEFEAVAPITELWPNPNSGTANLALDEGWGKKVDIEVTNDLGNRVLFRQADAEADRLVYLDLGNQPPGVYLVKVRNKDGQTAILKMVVVRP